MPFDWGSIGEGVATGGLSAAGNIVGGILQNQASDKATQENIAFQTELAKNGIQWKVADANAAGINPLYALGAPTESPAFSIAPNTAMADMSRNLGQDLSRAASATMSAHERVKKEAVDDVNLQSARSDLEGRQLKNDILRHQLADMTKSQPINPPLPKDGVHPYAHEVIKHATPSSNLNFGDYMRSVSGHPLDKSSWDSNVGDRWLEEWTKSGRKWLSDAYHMAHLGEFAKRMYKK